MEEGARRHGEELDVGRYDALTFDCYGTLVDWERGLLAALRRALPSAAAMPDEDLLEAYARHEAEAEQPPYRSYRRVLEESLRGLAAEHGLPLADDDASVFRESVRDWPPFADSAEALRRLQARFRLGVITNCDGDLFAASAARLGVAFDWVVTAEAAEAYKPSLRPFEVALEVVDVPRERILHVAQSLYHDHVPAARLGLTSVWIDRRHGRAGCGATPPATAAPAATFESMAAFADAAVGPQP
jgi:2-haloalkanoic acid dehalogenase type II